MSDKGSIKFQEALANKIKVWEKTEDFAAGSSNRQKLNRSLNLLIGSDPEVIIDMLGSDFVPDNPREAMNLIRGLDLKTLKSMEIFSLKGLGDKLVGHHEVAANTLGSPLRYMKPIERLDVYKGLADMGQRYGMDTKQILLIADSVHKNIAHGGDFSGKKTGVLLPYIVGESGVDFLKRFESSIGSQLKMAREAVNAPITQNYYQAINAAEDQIGLPRNTLINPDTPLTVKSAATNLLTPTAEQVRTIAKSGENITENVTDVLQQTEFNKKSVNNLIEAVNQTNINANVASSFDFSGSSARFSTKGFARGVGRFIPGPLDDVALGTGFGGIAAVGALATGGNPAQAFGDVVSDFAVGDLQGGELFDESKDFGKVVQQSRQQNAKPLIDRLNEGALGDAGRAIKRGGRISFGFAGAKFTLPEYGYSELLGVN